MRNLSTIDQSTQATAPTDEWVKCDTFNSNNKIVDQNGKEAGTDYSDRKYRIISKFAREYSCGERLGRGALGVATAIGTLLTGFLWADIRHLTWNLFTKSAETIHYAVPSEHTEKLLFDGVKYSETETINFLIETNPMGEESLNIVLTDLEGNHTPFNGSPAEALLMIAQNCASSLLCFLNHEKNNLITEAEFFSFLAEKDEQGTPRLLTLNPACTKKALEVIRRKKYPIDLHACDQNGETLLTKWADTSCNDIVKAILKLDSTTIKALEGRKISCLIPRALKTNKFNDYLWNHKVITTLLKAMRSQDVQLSQEEVLIEKIVNNDNRFTDEEFTSLVTSDEMKEIGLNLKKLIYYFANFFGREEIVARLNNLGMKPTIPTFPHPQVGILQPEMDIVTAKSNLEAFFSDLKARGLLLTDREFERLPQHQYMIKPCQIGHILGKNFIEHIVQKHGLKHIKVPKKIIAIDNNVRELKVRMIKDLDIHPTSPLSIYVEKVVPVKRDLSLEEAIELMIVIEETGYRGYYTPGDIRLHRSIILTATDIYFVDTKYDHFQRQRPALFLNIKTIRELLANSDDKAEFDRVFAERESAFEQRKDEIDAKYKEILDARRDHFVTLPLIGFAAKNFAFPLHSL